MHNIYCLVGRSGCGKTTIADALEREYGFKVLKSYTTRRKRQASDSDHIYIDEEDYFALQSKVATREAKDGNYCATKEQVDENDIYVVDFGGLFELEEKYKGDKGIVGIYIDVCPATSMARMQTRGDNIKAIANRMKRDMEDNTEENILQADMIVNGDDILTYQKVYDYIMEREKND